MRSFDAVRLRIDRSVGRLDAFAARVVIPYDAHFNRANNYDWFSGIYASTRQLVPSYEADLFLLARNVSAGSPTAITPTLGGPSSRDIYTLGTRWKSVTGRFGPWDYLLEAAAQRGRIDLAGRRLEHRAWALNVTGGYTWKAVFGTPRLGAGYDFGTGDANPSDARNGTFELLFGTNHRLYGNMDLIGLRNIHIPRLEASLKPRPDLTLSFEYLGYWLADTADFLYPESGAGRNGNGYGRNPQLSSQVGQAVEFLADWRPGSWGLLRVGAAHFFTGKYIKESIGRVPGNRGAEDAQWLYLQATFTF